MEYQRDRVTFGVFQKLVVKLYKAVLFKLSNQKEKLEWQLLLIADCLRIIGLCRLAYRMASKVHTSKSSVKNKFWSTHVSGMALQYSGDMIGAEKAFLKSQDFACELSLSFSLQHLGKLNVAQNGSCCKAASTRIASPLMPLRKSTTSRHRYTAGSSFAGRIFNRGPQRYSAPWQMSWHRLNRKTPPTHHSAIECATRYPSPDQPSEPAETGLYACGVTRLS